MKINTGTLVFGGIFIACAWFLGWLLTSQTPTAIVGVLGAIGLIIIAFRANDTFLPVILLLTLALGSCYRWDITMKSFYVRFFFLGLVAIRGMLAFFASKATSSNQGRNDSRSGATLVHWIFLAVALMGLSSSIFSVDPALTAKRAATFLFLFFVIFIYFWVRSRRFQECEAFAVAMWRSCAIILGIGFLFLAMGVHGMLMGPRLRLVVGNPNQLGHYCALMAPIVIWYLFEKAIGRKRFLAGSVLVAFLISILWSGSRGALLTSFGAALVQFLLAYPKKTAALLIVMSVGISVHFLLESRVPKRSQGPSHFEETILRTETLYSGSGRFGVWSSAHRVIQKKPFFGHGFGVVDRLFRLGYFPDLPVEFQGDHVHNGYVEELVNLGWIGAGLLFVALVYLLTVGALSLMKPFRRTPSYRFSCALFSVVIAGAVSNVFESWFTSVGSVFCFPFWFSGALLLRMTQDFCDWRSSPA